MKRWFKNLVARLRYRWTGKRVQPPVTSRYPRM